MGNKCNKKRKSLSCRKKAAQHMLNVIKRRRIDADEDSNANKENIPLPTLLQPPPRPPQPPSLPPPAKPGTSEDVPNVIESLQSNYVTMQEETTDDLPYISEAESQKDTNLPMQGRRIVDMMHFIQQLKKISSHGSLFNCNFNEMSLIGETRNGLISKYKFRCNMCQKDFLITSEDPVSEENIDVNLAAVTGITSAGIAYSQFQEITACMNVPIFSEKTYCKFQDVIYFRA